MTLGALRLRGAVRSLATRPVWLGASLLVLVAILFYGYRLVLAGVNWILAYPQIDSIATAVIQRSLEGLFLVLMAAVLFSVLVASIGTLYGSEDLELLLSQPIPGAGVFTMKTAELFVNAAGLPLLFTFPVLIAVGNGLDAHPLYYPVSIVATVALYALPVTFGALLALLLVRVSPVGRVREVATAVSVAAAAFSVLGLRMLRPEQLANLSGPEEFETVLTGLARLELGWLPPAWATSGSWAALSGDLHPALLALTALGGGGLVLTAFLAHRAYALGWVRSLDAPPAPSRRAASESRPPVLERFLQRRFGTVGSILAKDVRTLLRDVQQWSQLLVLVALAGVYFVSLAAVPVPTQQFKDVMGALNVALVGFLMSGVALRIAYPGISYEGATYWLVQTQPLRKRDLVIAKFLLALPIMLTLGLVLGITAGRVLDVSPTIALALPLASGAAAIAMSGLAVGLGAMNPKFAHTNPNEIVMSPGAFAFMGLGVLYTAALTVLLARPAWVAIISGGRGGYWATGEGLLVLGLLATLTAFTTVVPLVLGWRALQRLE